MIAGPPRKLSLFQRAVDGPKLGLDEACLGSLSGHEADQAGGAPPGNCMPGGPRTRRCRRLGAGESFHPPAPEYKRR